MYYINGEHTKQSMRFKSALRANRGVRRDIRRVVFIFEHPSYKLANGVGALFNTDGFNSLFSSKLLRNMILTKAFFLGPM